MSEVQSALPWNPVAPAWMTPRIAEALAFTSRSHAAVNHVRRYTGEPYVYHVLEVCTILYDRFPQLVDEAPEILIAALLHDDVEDCNVTFTEIERRFGAGVMELVMFVTDLVTKEQANRATRKLLESSRLHVAPFAAQMMKLADMMSNTTSITKHDPNFSQKYLREIHQNLHAISLSWVTHPERVAYFEAFELFNDVLVQVETAAEALGINLEE
jgi:(p)ppGpp synthase/HD superfamily hydrolase